MAIGDEWNDDQDGAVDSNPYGYTLEPEEERDDDDDREHAAAAAHPEAPTTEALASVVAVPALAPALPLPAEASPANSAVAQSMRVEGDTLYVKPHPYPAHADVELEAAAPALPDAARAAVVSIDSARQKRAAATVAKLPEVTGLASFRTDHPIHEVDILLADLRRSALTDETIEAARLTCIPYAKWRAYGFRCQLGKYNDPDARAAAAGLLLPFFAPYAVEPHGMRLRPEYPVPVPRTKPGQKQRFKKYDQAFGTDLLVYTPPLAACLSQLRADTPLYWTEGEKKALVIAQLGHCVVGLTGVDSWSQPGSKSSRLHSYIAQHYGIAGRDHVIVYDADAHTNPSVLMAMRKLAGILHQLGACSVTMALPPLEYASAKSEKPTNKGIDDYAYAHGLEAAQTLLTTTRDEIAEVAPRVPEQQLEGLSAFADLTRAHGFVVPVPYAVDDAGVVWLHAGYGDGDKSLVCPRPIFVTRVLQDLHRNGEYRVELQFQTVRGSWQSIRVPRALSGSRALVSELRRAGAVVDDTSVTDVIKWLTAWEVRNGAQLEPVQCVDRTGWCDKQFALGPDMVFAPAGAPPLAFDVNYDQARVFEALGYRAAEPELEASHHAAALQAAAQASDDCAIAIFAALTAPLLRPFSLPNFAVHLCGDSSRGKTSMLRCAASVFGDPSNSAWVPSWNVTLAGLEQHAVQLCDLPLCFDEAGTSDAETVQTAIYMLINGVGRARSTKELTMRRTASWQTVVVSTGERELAPESAATGAQVRVISLPITGFGTLDGPGVDRVREGCAAHAGALGMLWLRKVVDIASNEAQLLAARERLQSHRAALREIARASGNPLNGRIADYFASMALAEDLVSEYGLGQPGGLTVRQVFERRCNGCDDDGGGSGGEAPETLIERVLSALEAWPAQAPSAFPKLISDAADTETRREVHGYIRDDGARCFIPQSLKAYLANIGLSWTNALKRELVARGRLAKQKGRNVACKVRINGTSQRLYVLTAAVDDEAFR
jgi:hypothetical protein